MRPLFALLEGSDENIDYEPCDLSNSLFGTTVKPDCIVMALGRNRARMLILWTGLRLDIFRRDDDWNL